MAQHVPARWILAYDIGYRRRGSAVLRRLKKDGLPLQYSVFIVEASSTQIQKLMMELKDIINPNQDDIRAYRWPLDAPMVELGRPLLYDKAMILSKRGLVAPCSDR